MREITIDERDFAGPRDFMAWIKEALEFPEYAGNSLAALYDCLGDICEPTTISILRRNPEPDTWFDKASLCIVRASMENDNVKVRIR